MIAWLRRLSGRSPRSTTPASPPDARPAVPDSRGAGDGGIEALRAAYRSGTAAERLDAVRALSALTDPSVADMLVRGCPRDASTALGTAVVVALHRRGDRRAATFLAKVLKRIPSERTDRGGRSWSVDIAPPIAEVAEGLGELDDEAARLLVGCLADGAASMCDRVTRVLATRWRASGASELMAVIDDPQTRPEVCGKAIRALLSIGGPPSDRLVDILALARGFSREPSVLESLERADPGWRTSPEARKAVPGLLRVLTGSPNHLGARERAAETLGLIGDAHAFAPLLDLLGDKEHAEVAMSVLSSILVSEGSKVPSALLEKAGAVGTCTQQRFEEYESLDRTSAGLRPLEVEVDATRLRTLAREELRRRQPS